MKKLPFYRFSGIIFIRMMVGLVFLSEGVQKFLFPVANGAGRFAKLGIPYPHFFGPFVGGVEVLCGILLIIGWLTRLAAVPLFIVMLVAIYTTKMVPFDQKGFWLTAHEGRADFCMFVGLIFLMAYGAGLYSVDSTSGVKTKSRRR